MEQSKLDRINVLAKKKKEAGLTSVEQEEQAVLRKEFIELFKKNFIGTLETIKIQDEFGNITPLKNKNTK